MTEQAQPVFQIQRVYLKDLSLELPNAPQIFLEQSAPQVDVSLDTSVEALADGIVEVVVTSTVTTRINNKVAFLIEGKQAGIFEIRHIPADQAELISQIACPNIIYPYLRANIADLVQRAGFPPIHLNEVNWEAFYQQRLQVLANAQQSSEGAGIVMPDGSKASVQ